MIRQTRTRGQTPSVWPKSNYIHFVKTHFFFSKLESRITCETHCHKWLFSVYTVFPCPHSAWVHDKTVGRQSYVQWECPTSGSGTLLRNVRLREVARFRWAKLPWWGCVTFVWQWRYIEGTRWLRRGFVIPAPNIHRDFEGFSLLQDLFITSWILLTEETILIRGVQPCA